LGGGGESLRGLQLPTNFRNLSFPVSAFVLVKKKKPPWNIKEARGIRKLQLIRAESVRAKSCHMQAVKETRKGTWRRGRMLGDLANSLFFR